MRINSVCLIRPPDPEVLDPAFDLPFGLVCLATTLKRAGFGVRIVDLALENDLNAAIPQDFDAYGISSVTGQWDIAVELLGKIRVLSPRSIVVAGGPHPSALPSECLKDGFNAIFVGESSLTLPEVLGNWPPQFPIIVGEPPDINHVHPLDYSLVDCMKYRRKLDGKPAARIYFSRGCDRRCAFCQVRNLFPTLRFLNLNIAQEELNQLSDLGFSAFFVGDNYFTFSQSRQYWPLLSKYGIWACLARVDTLQDPDIAKRMADNGCFMVSLGVESLSQKILNAMKKDYTAEDAITAAENLKRAGIAVVRALFMVGFPGETWMTVKETAEMARYMPFDEFRTVCFLPYPGTDVFQNLKAYGLSQLSPNWSKYHPIDRGGESHCMFSTKNYQPEEILRMREFLQKKLEAKR